MKPEIKKLSEIIKETSKPFDTLCWLVLVGENPFIELHKLALFVDPKNKIAHLTAIDKFLTRCSQVSHASLDSKIEFKNPWNESETLVIPFESVTRCKAIHTNWTKRDANTNTSDNQQKYKRPQKFY
jgi:hypothetical protein